MRLSVAVRVVTVVLGFVTTVTEMQAEFPFFARAAQEDPASFRTATFEFNRTGVQVPHWIVEVHADGSGVYTGSTAAGVAETSQAIRISDAEEKRITAVYPVVQTGKCETKQKNIANTGRKTLTMQASDGTAASCTFNFSESEPLNALADTFIAIAETMQAGERLAQKHRYDRLGVDAEIDALIEGVKSGRAADVQNIAPVLQALVDDERLMERVRRKAARLLQEAGAAPPANSAR